eukprot:4366837-Amphidinium_carterae.1
MEEKDGPVHRLLHYEDTALLLVHVPPHRPSAWTTFILDLVRECVAAEKCCVLLVSPKDSILPGLLRVPGACQVLSRAGFSVAKPFFARMVVYFRGDLNFPEFVTVPYSLDVAAVVKQGCYPRAWVCALVGCIVQCFSLMLRSGTAFALDKMGAQLQSQRSKIPALIPEFLRVATVPGLSHGVHLRSTLHVDGCPGRVLELRSCQGVEGNLQQTAK